MDWAREWGGEHLNEWADTRVGLKARPPVEERKNRGAGRLV